MAKCNQLTSLPLNGPRPTTFSFVKPAFLVMRYHRSGDTRNGDKLMHVFGTMSHSYSRRLKEKIDSSWVYDAVCSAAVSINLMNANWCRTRQLPTTIIRHIHVVLRTDAKPAGSDGVGSKEGSSSSPWGSGAFRNLTLKYVPPQSIIGLAACQTEMVMTLHGQSTWVTVAGDSQWVCTILTFSDRTKRLSRTWRNRMIVNLLS